MTMDFQNFVDSVAMPCCILSVQKKPEGTCGEIRIVCANQMYKNTMGSKYCDDMLYSELVPQDNTFEDLCFRAAIYHERMRSYVETKFLNCWTDQSFVPLASDREDIGYVQFVFEFTNGPDAERMASVSFDTAAIVIRSCIKMMGSNDFQESVASVLQDVVDTAEAAMGRIMVVNHQKREADVFCEYVRKNIWPYADPENDPITYDLIQTWDALIGASNVLIVQNEGDFKNLEKKNAEWVASMREHHVKSLALIPLRRLKNVIGYLYVVNFNVSKVIEVKELIELISFFLGSEISSYLFFRRLENLSTFDQLTGLKNRYALTQVVETLDKETDPQPYGIINLDLNGLKVVNDKEGHVAGDELLIKTAEFLRSEFRDDDLYRIGGDEFIVLILGISEEIFNRRVESLREMISEKEGEISIAFGTFWNDGSISTYEAFLTADHSMYADKKEYYRTHPIQRNE